MRRFLDTVNNAFPDVGPDGGARQRIIDSAFRMTDELVGLGLDMTVVEGSGSFCDSLAARHRGLEVAHSLFEDFAPTRRFDNIILGHVLEHVDDPVAVIASRRN